ncbi:hypothetical protein [Noviherbaspirillum galbum]|uniref:Uncharacterized protein n=1 Tax=Noviherbaspirillum galbum TaxID=2709383 RepID=A0A6B3SR96_9BURK|nr:hypothetical protein [Noviherbaspirillum galbum]NEX63048.1 hypothetical protein [Noviherbaspirillum galbum]
MQSLTSAKEAIKAELAHVRQGAEYYMNLANALEEALEKLESVEGSGDDDRKGGQRGRRGTRSAKTASSSTGASKRTVAARAGRGAAKQAAKGAGRAAKSAGGRLPKTGMDFWMKLLSQEPKSAGDILNAAISQLGLQPDGDQKKKLVQRQTYALNTLVKENKIGDEGSRRTRRFFVRGGEQARQ